MSTIENIVKRRIDGAREAVDALEGLQPSSEGKRYINLAIQEARWELEMGNALLDAIARGDAGHVDDIRRRLYDEGWIEVKRAPVEDPCSLCGGGQEKIVLRRGYDTREMLVCEECGLARI